MSQTDDTPRQGGEVPERAIDALEPLVLSRALGTSLAPDESVLCARSVWSTKGRLIGSAGDHQGTHLAVVTDRRVMRITAWRRSIDVNRPGREALGLDEVGVKGFITRHSVWLGEIREAEAGTSWFTDQRLLVRTADGRRQAVIARAETVRALEAAIRLALEGKGRWTLPPVPASAGLIAPWSKRIAAVVRDSSAPRG